MKPSIKDVAKGIHTYGQQLKQYNPDDIDDGGGNIGGDVRLRLWNGGWEILTGDSSYDQDHRGYWGSGWTPAGCSVRQARDIARDMINQALDMAADNEV